MTIALGTTVSHSSEELEGEKMELIAGSRPRLNEKEAYERAPDEELCEVRKNRGRSTALRRDLRSTYPAHKYRLD
jgi:hypothetical protein